MLERVMRRFGVSAPGRSREPTYYEALLDDSREPIADALEGGSTDDVLDRVALALIETESARGKLAQPTVENRSQRSRVRDYVALLRDNDCQPLSGQLGREELGMARQLILSSGEAGSPAKIYEEVLVLLEEKFSSGLFTQASLLLRLFETTAARRRSNEKTLFYEEMIARFGVTRVQRIATHLVRRFHKAMSTREEHAPRIAGAARWLAQTANVRLHVRRRAPDEIDLWSEALADFEAPARHAVLGLVAPARWRPVTEDEGPVIVRDVASHLTDGALIDYADRLLRAVYFIVVVTTRTGFEPLIRDYFAWVERQFRFPGSRLLPQLHKWTTLDERGLDESVRALREEHFAARLGELRSELAAERIERGLGALARQLRLLDPNELPPGDYDLTGLLIDHMTGFNNPDPTVPFRVHRLC